MVSIGRWQVAGIRSVKQEVKSGKLGELAAVVQLLTSHFSLLAFRKPATA
jgi:hypothetical protein